MAAANFLMSRGYNSRNSLSVVRDASRADSKDGKRIHRRTCTPGHRQRRYGEVKLLSLPAYALLRQVLQVRLVEQVQAHEDEGADIDGRPCVLVSRRQRVLSRVR